ncbi:type II toxin-antitoxin system YoeB family toxin [bacterium]|nr:type II toxin-antitoxin system YoeB family toxin [bacterium]MBU1599729.1 type II toxin-antitoxin system YoeB family toxin [bacterium]
MKVEFKASFYRTFDKYSLDKQEKIYSTIEHLIQSIGKNEIPKGLGMKLMRSKSRIWEARVSDNMRIIFRYKADVLEFGIVGSHDEIKRYLKNF